MYGALFALILINPLFSIVETPENIFTSVGFNGYAYPAGPG